MARPKGSKDLKPRFRRNKEQMREQIIKEDAVAWEEPTSNESTS